jgi:hypothetical protein
VDAERHRRDAARVEGVKAFLRRVRWMPVTALALAGAGLVLGTVAAIVDKVLYPVGIAAGLAAVTCAILTGRDDRTR